MSRRRRARTHGSRSSVRCTPQSPGCSTCWRSSTPPIAPAPSITTPTIGGRRDAPLRDAPLLDVVDPRPRRRRLPAVPLAIAAVAGHPLAVAAAAAVFRRGGGLQVDEVCFDETSP